MTKEELANLTDLTRKFEKEYLIVDKNYFSSEEIIRTRLQLEHFRDKIVIVWKKEVS